MKTKFAFLGNYWRVDVGKIPDDKLRRQNTSVSRNVQTGFSYSADLNEVFFIGSGKIRRRISQNMLTVHTGITPVLLQPIGDGFVQKPVSHYEEHNAPTILEVIQNTISSQKIYLPENELEFEVAFLFKKSSIFNCL